MANTPRFGRETNRTRMVVGFAFNPVMTRVALIEKKREPANAEMIGTFNGIGGHCDARETYLQAMCREFLQEAYVAVGHWTHFATIDGDSWRLYCYRAQLSERQWRRIRTLDNSRTDEHVRKVSIVQACPAPRIGGDGPGLNVYPDVPYLVQLAACQIPMAVAKLDYRSI